MTVPEIPEPEIRSAEPFDPDEYLKSGLSRLDGEIAVVAAAVAAGEARLAVLREQRRRFEVVLGTAEAAPPEPVAPEPTPEAPPRRRRLPGPRRVTVQQVRDSVVRLSDNLAKDPEMLRRVATGSTKTHLLPGYFLAKHIADEMGVSTSSIYTRLAQLAKDGIVTTKPFKSGSQYHRVPSSGRVPDPASELQAGRGPDRSVDRGAVFGGVGRETPGTGQQARLVGDKDLEGAIRRARSQGYTVTAQGTGHVRVSGENGRSVTVPSTPSKVGTVSRVLDDLRKMGVRL